MNPGAQGEKPSIEIQFSQKQRSVACQNRDSTNWQQIPAPQPPQKSSPAPAGRCPAQLFDGLTGHFCPSAAGDSVDPLPIQDQPQILPIHHKIIAGGRQFQPALPAAPKGAQLSRSIRREKSHFPLGMSGSRPGCHLQPALLPQG